jgi:ubiquinone/menaquinone biosynthesis C-methylase UbiE
MKSKLIPILAFCPESGILFSPKKIMEKKHVCPWWLGYFLINPLRKFRHHPEKILGPYVKPGMNVIDYGCAMGYFSLPLARMVGEKGKVLCMDIQQKMLTKLQERAKKAKLDHLVEILLLNEQGGLKIPEKTIDFVLLFAVAHEVDNQPELFSSLSSHLKPGGFLLFAEPKGHVSLKDFDISLIMAENEGLIRVKSIEIANSWSVLLQKL